MKVALAYDEQLAAAYRASLPQDAGAEYEDAAAIQGLLNAIAACDPFARLLLLLSPCDHLVSSV